MLGLMTGMPMYYGGGAAAAAAAARRRRMEEEEMALYSDEDIAEGWEFKIVRCATSGFRKPEFLQRVCDEEARAGWVLLEKFDNRRVRFKRPASAKANDRMAEIDPYRTWVGMSPVRFAFYMVFGIIAAMASAMLLFALLENAFH